MKTDDIVWTFDERPAPPITVHVSAAPPATAAITTQTSPPATERSRPDSESAATGHPAPPFGSLWEFALAVNRGDAAALALAGNGSDGGVPIDAAELRKLLGTVWFRSVFPRLSRRWRDRLFEVVIESVPLQNHVLRG